MRLNGLKPYLIIQVEDLPFLDSNSGIKGLIDKFTFRFLFKRSRINLFASKLCYITPKKGEFNLYSKSYIYPPSLEDEYLTLIKNRKEPFSNERIIIMYAGSLSQRKRTI